MVAFGFRDAAEAAQYGSQALPPTIRAFDLVAVRRRGAELAARDAVEHVARSDLDGFWIHLDADVLDDAIMPAVDYRMPGGLSWSELAIVLRTAMESGKVAGIEVTIFNPMLDSSGAIAGDLVDVLASSLGPSPRPPPDRDSTR